MTSLRSLSVNVCCIILSHSLYLSVTVFFFGFVGFPGSRQKVIDIFYCYGVLMVGIRGNRYGWDDGVFFGGNIVVMLLDKFYLVLAMILLVFKVGRP